MSREDDFTSDCFGAVGTDWYVDAFDYRDDDYGPCTCGYVAAVQEARANDRDEYPSADRFTGCVGCCDPNCE